MHSTTFGMHAMLIAWFIIGSGALGFLANNRDWPVLLKIIVAGAWNCVGAAGVLLAVLLGSAWIWVSMLTLAGYLLAGLFAFSSFSIWRGLENASD